MPDGDDSLVVPAEFAETGRGYACVRDVSTGEELLSVPLDECWHAAPARSALAHALPFTAQLCDHDAVCLHLLHERAKGKVSSRWAHIATLPSEYDVPVFWSAAEREVLAGSGWLELVGRYEAEMCDDWRALGELARSAAGAWEAFVGEAAITLEAYKWAYATVKSRSAEVDVHGVPTKLLAPRFDLFNHSDDVAPGSSHFYDEARGALVALAARDYAAGEQAFISYGSTISNGALLLGGGFVLAHNHSDAVDVPLTVACDTVRRLRVLNDVAELADVPDHVSRADLGGFELLQTPTESDVRAAAAAGGGAPLVSRHMLTQRAPLPARLVAYARLDRASSAAELDALGAAADALGARSLTSALLSPRSIEPLNEACALGALLVALRGMLERYPTCLEADEAELARRAVEPDGGGGAAVRRRVMGLVLVSGEKRILRRSVDAAQRRLDLAVADLLDLARGDHHTPAEAPSAAARPENVHHAIGSRVRIHGLSSRADLNGCYATVVRWARTGGRWVLRPEGSDELVRVRPQFVLPADDAAAAEPSGAVGRHVERLRAAGVPVTDTLEHAVALALRRTPAESARAASRGSAAVVRDRAARMKAIEEDESVGCDG